MSDIGILNDPLSLAFIALLFSWPGLLLGAIAGALLWRRHRIVGALIGAVLGGVACLFGVMWWRDMI
jgi:hypothetical protein